MNSRHRATVRYIAAATVALTVSFSAALAAETAADLAEGSIWMLAPTSNEIRWLEIHHVERGGPNSVYHVSVLARGKSDPVWKVQHLVPHIAITDAALRRSVIELTVRIRPSYPETYDDAYRRWLALKSDGKAATCDTSIIECAHL
jgi:Domain of unknown function (DUF5086)